MVVAAVAVEVVVAIAMSKVSAAFRVPVELVVKLPNVIAMMQAALGALPKLTGRKLFLQVEFTTSVFPKVWLDL